MHLTGQTPKNTLKDDQSPINMDGFTPMAALKFRDPSYTPKQK